MLRGAAEPFQPTGGLKLLDGPLGRAVIKVSAVAPERHVIEAPARVFHDQEERAGGLQGRRAGPRRRRRRPLPGPEGQRHAGAAQADAAARPCCRTAGFKVALVTDGRLSGASGKVPAAIHVTPEAEDGGPIARLVDGVAGERFCVRNSGGAQALWRAWATIAVSI